MKHDDLQPFCEDVRRFVSEALPESVRAAVARSDVLTHAQLMDWQHKLNRQGWGAPGWPVEHGGTGWPLFKQAILQEELVRAGAPLGENLGLTMIGQTLIAYGTPEQKARFLPRIISGEDFWAQAYSEPEAGSDLASLRCAAVADGDSYIVNGTKIWQSHAHHANWAFALVRTTKENRKQDGISVLLIDLALPGVTVRPIRFLNGLLFHNEMFFDNVRVPKNMLVGSEGKGWSVAKSLLMVERLFVGRVAEITAEFAKLKLDALHNGHAGTSLLDEPWYARRVAQFEIRRRAYESAWWDAIGRAESGAVTDAEVSKLRLLCTGLVQDVHGLRLEIAGSLGLAADPALSRFDDTGNSGAYRDGSARICARFEENIHVHHFRFRGVSLGSGSAEVQRDIIAREVFNRGAVIEDGRLTDVQRMVGDALERLLSHSYGHAQRRRIVNELGGLDPAFWTDLSAMGVLGLLAPPEAGGIGGNAGDMVKLAASMGGALVVEPWAWSAVGGVVLSRLAGASGAKLLPVKAIALGDLQVAHAWLEADARFDLSRCQAVAVQDGTGWRLSGEKVLVFGAATAQRITVTARVGSTNGELALFAFDPSEHTSVWRRRDYQTYDGRAVSNVTFADLLLDKTALMAQGPNVAHMLDTVDAYLTLATCAEAGGAMKQALALTISYMTTRTQFGQPIASFQALRHRVVDHCLKLYNCHALIELAAAAIDAATDHPAASTDGSRASAAAVAAAKHYIGHCAKDVGHDVLQLHGAIGFQDETPISHFAKRLVATDAMLGDSEFQLSRFVALSR